MVMDRFTRFTVVIISQYIHISKHYIVHLKHNKSVISKFKKRFKKKLFPLLFLPSLFLILLLFECWDNVDVYSSCFICSILFNYINLSVYLLLFGCIRSQLWHPGPSLCYVGDFILEHGLCTCRVQAPEQVGSSSCSVQVTQWWYRGSSACGLGSCSAQAQLLCSMGDLSSPTRD